jgi:23S rRNA (cytidine1920-2'-O)/16S rRNA (cytidine1409-2'-O)-methyltransferase
MKSKSKERLDKLLVTRGLVETRAKAQALILAGQVFSDQQRLDKAGASTGGFTDCLLQRGAERVVAIDVGHGQIDWKLRQDVRVEVRENINARYLSPEDFSERFDLAVADVSFISLTKILPVLPPLLQPSASVITLIKPQFEVGRDEVGKGGIVRDEEAQQRVVEEIMQFAASIGLCSRGVIDSPILGADGNREFLVCFEAARSDKIETQNKEEI